MVKEEDGREEETAVVVLWCAVGRAAYEAVAVSKRSRLITHSVDLSCSVANRSTLAVIAINDVSNRSALVASEVTDVPTPISKV